jgi:Fe-Mn family superoxide dismutase
MGYHYGKHHLAYVNNLNKYIVGSEFEKMDLNEIVKKSNGLILNNAAQHWNHTFYWFCLTPKKDKNPSVLLQKALDKYFGSFGSFKSKFVSAAMEVFGSGWAWLVQDVNGNLIIKTTGNADNPLRVGDKVLFTCDVWEHAYYVDYRNSRTKYLEAIWDIVDWEFVSQNFEALK